jgi:hypothetical protein
MITAIPDIDLIAAAAALVLIAIAVRVAYRRRRPKFLYGENQSVARVQQTRRLRTFEVKEDLESRHFSPTV